MKKITHKFKGPQSVAYRDVSLVTHLLGLKKPNVVVGMGAVWTIYSYGDHGVRFLKNISKTKDVLPSVIVYGDIENITNKNELKTLRAGLKLLEESG